MLKSTRIKGITPNITNVYKNIQHIDHTISVNVNENTLITFDVTKNFILTFP